MKNDTPKYTTDSKQYAHSGSMKDASAGRVVTSRGTPKAPKGMNSWSMDSIARPKNRTSVVDGSVNAKKGC